LGTKSVIIPKIKENQTTTQKTQGKITYRESYTEELSHITLASI